MDFEEFLDAELAGLTRFAGVLTGDRQLAHDTLADALVKAAAAWSRIGRMQFPAAYVRRMVTTTFLAERRRYQRRRTEPVGDLTGLDRAAPDRTEALGHRDQLAGMLLGLSRQQRAALVMRFYLDLTDDEVAVELGCSSATVRSHVSRGLAALRLTHHSLNINGGI